MITTSLREVVAAMHLSLVVELDSMTTVRLLTGEKEVLTREKLVVEAIMDSMSIM